MGYNYSRQERHELAWIYTHTGKIKRRLNLMLNLNTLFLKNHPNGFTDRNSQRQIVAIHIHQTFSPLAFLIVSVFLYGDIKSGLTITSFIHTTNWDFWTKMQHLKQMTMGLTFQKWQDFKDLLIQANNMQLEVMQTEINKEKQRRR